MEACVVFCRAKKPPKKRGKVLLIDAVNEVARQRTMSFLRPEHQGRIEATYEAFADEEGFAKVATLEEIAAQGFSLSIPLYVKRQSVSSTTGSDAHTLSEAWVAWEDSARAFWIEMDAVVDMLDGLVADDREPAAVANG
jgi:type I restriction enzyme M protein